MMTRRRSLILVLFLFPAMIPAFAQQGNAVDSVKVDTTVADTIFVGAKVPAIKTYLDTSFSASPESGVGTIPTGQPPVLRSIPDSTVTRWQHDPKFAYANDPGYWKIRRPSEISFGRGLDRILRSKAFRYIILFLLGALLLYAIVRIIMDNNVNLFYRRTRTGGAHGDDLGSLPPQEDIEERIRHFLQIGDQRQATRYLYLKSLHLLSGRNLIQWHVDSTNQDYLDQLKGRPELPSFRFLTTAYEMVWYGEFVLSEGNFARLQQHFTEFFKTLAS